ncbi:MAG: alpha/beta hydrolase [Caldilineaceae bacterium]
MGKGAPIFFLHGSSGSHHYFLPYLEPLADQYQLIFYDQRGTGQSDGKLDLKAITIDQFVEDLEALRVALGFEKISLLAHSSGSVIALFYAIKYPEHLNSLILIAPFPVTPKFAVEFSQTLRQRVEGLSDEAKQTLASTCRRSLNGLSDDERLTCLKIDALLRFYDPSKVLTMDTTLEKNTLRNAATIESLLTTSFNRKQKELEAKLSTISVPMLIIHGSFDPIPISSSKYIQQQISNAQLVVLEQSGHFPFVEQPEKLVETVQKFLSEHK